MGGGDILHRKIGVCGSNKNLWCAQWKEIKNL